MVAGQHHLAAHLNQVLRLGGQDHLLYDPHVLTGSLHPLLPGRIDDVYGIGDFISDGLQKVRPLQVDDRLHVIRDIVLIHESVFLSLNETDRYISDIIFYDGLRLYQQLIPVRNGRQLHHDRRLLILQFIDLLQEPPLQDPVLFTVEQIAQGTGLSVAEVQELAAQL